MPKSLHVHIGVGKTGTSAIQGYFAHFADRLAKENSLRYFKSGLINHAHQLISPAYQPQRKTNWSAELDALAAENAADTCERGFISSEFLCWNDFEYVRRFQRKFSDTQIHVIFLVREIGELLYASFLQRVKTRPGEMAATDFDFPSFVKKYGLKMNFNRLLQPWEKVFGKDSITVLDYNRLDNGDSAAALCQMLGVPRHEFSEPPRAVNASLTDADVTILRFAKQNWKPTAPQFKELVPLLLASKTGRTSTRLPEEQRDFVESLFAERDLMFRERFGMPERRFDRPVKAAAC